MPESALEWLDLVNKALTSLAILVGGGWALFTFVLFRTSTFHLRISITPEVIQKQGELRLVLISVSLTNAGKVKITAGREGCRLSMWKMLPRFEPGESLSLEEGAVLLDNIDLLAGYDKQFAYGIEPDSEYHEYSSVVAAVDDLLTLKVTFYLAGRGGDAISEYEVFHVQP